MTRRDSIVTISHDSLAWLFRIAHDRSQLRRRADVGWSCAKTALIVLNEPARRAPAFQPCEIAQSGQGVACRSTPSTVEDNVPTAA